MKELEGDEADEGVVFALIVRVKKTFENVKSKYFRNWVCGGIHTGSSKV